MRRRIQRCGTALVLGAGGLGASACEEDPAYTALPSSSDASAPAPPPAELDETTTSSGDETAPAGRAGRPGRGARESSPSSERSGGAGGTDGGEPRDDAGDGGADERDTGAGESELPRAPATPEPPPLPDLMLDAAYLMDTLEVDRVTIDDMCLVAEACVRGTGERRVLRFGSRTGNLGTADFVLGAPEASNPYWTFNACQESYDLVGFARYALTEAATGLIVAEGAKSGFCIADAERWEGDGERGSCDVYDCRYQGISRGCADNYGAALECQWVDITGVPDGTYDLQVTINAGRQIEELDHVNNVVRVRVAIDGDEVSVAP